MAHAHRKQVEGGVGEKAPLLDRLVFWKPDLTTLTGKTSRTIDRWISAGEFPKADVTISGKPVWRRETLQAWSRGE
jgi:predicted DNA-binding transcriptional regulator AlpA